MIEDSQRVGELLAGGRGHLGVIGGGFIGVEAAASARMKGLDVTMVAPETGALGAPVRRAGGRYFQGHMEQARRAVITGSKELPPGDYDMVIAGIGVDPQHRAGQGAPGCRPTRASSCDERLVAAPGVWAAGDIAEYQSAIHGRRIRDRALGRRPEPGRLRRPHWAGSEEGPYTVVPYFFSDLADWTWIEYVGPAGPDDEATVRGSMDDDDFVVYYSRDGRVTGCLGVNRSDDVEAAKQLIADGAGVPEG